MSKILCRPWPAAAMMARAIVACTLSAGALPATHAQALRNAPDPADARADVPRLSHRSPLADYRRHADQELVPWKQANETVTRIGGWRAYAREAQAPDAPAPAAGARTAPSPAASPATQSGQERR